MRPSVYFLGGWHPGCGFSRSGPSSIPPMKSRRDHSLALVFAVLLAGAVPLLGQTDTWTNGGADNLWNTNGNWTTAAPPLATETARFGTNFAGGSNSNCQMATSRTALGVSMGTYTSTININGQTLTLNAGAGNFTTATASDFTIAGGGGTVSGNWLVQTTAGNITTFSGNLTITGNYSNTISHTLTVNAGIILTINGNLNPTAALTIAGTGTVVVLGSVTGTGNITFSSSATLRIGGGYTNTGTLTAGTTSTIEYNAAGAQTVRAAVTYNNLTVSGGSTKALAAGTTTVNSTMTVSGGTTLDLTGQTLSMVTAAFNGSGTILSGAGTGTISGTVTVGGTAAITLSMGNPITCSGAWTLTGTLSVSGAANLSFGSTLADNGTLTLGGTGTVAVTGTVSGTGVVDFTAAQTLDLSGGFTTSGPFTAGTGTVRYVLGGAQTVRGGITYNLLVLAGTGTKTMGASATVSGTCTVTSTLAIGGTTLTMGASSDLAGAGGVTMGAGVLLIGNTWSGTGAFTNGTGTVDYYRAGNQTIRSGITYDQLTTSGNGSKTLVGATSVDTTVTVSAGTTLDLAGQTLTMNTVGIAGSGTITNSTGTGTISGATTVSGGATIALDLANPVTGSGAWIVTGTLNVGGASTLSFGSTLAVGGTLTLGGTGTVAVASTLSGTGPISFTAAQTLDLSAGFTNSGAFDAGTGTVRYILGGAQTVRGGITYNLLVLAGTGTKTMGASATVNGVCTVTSTLAIGGTTLTMGASSDLTGAGTVTSGAGILNIGNAWTGTGTFTASTGTVNYSGAGAQTVRALTGANAYNNLTLSGSGTKSLAAGTTTVNGILSPSGTATFSLGTATLTLAGTLTTAGTATLDLGTGTCNVGGAGTSTVASGTTLLLAASGGSAPTLSFGAGAGPLNVNGGFAATWSSGPKPIVTGAAAEADLNLLGATVNITGLDFRNGPADGLLVGQNGGANCTITAFREVDFTLVAAGSRHLTVIAAAPFSLLAEDCTFDATYLPGGANVRVDKNTGAGDTVVTVVGRPTPLGGWGQEAAEGGPGTGPDDDDDAGPSAAISRDGQCTWAFGGGQLTTSPGTGEVYTDPDTYTGGQGYLTSHYNWNDFGFIGSYVLVRTSTANDLLVALDASGKPKSYSPYSFDKATYGRIVGSPWTASLGAGGSFVADEVIMWLTDKGYIFVVEDTGSALADWPAPPATAIYPRRPWVVDPGTPVATKGYSLLIFDTGGDVAGNDNDRFYFCGADGTTNGIYVTSCFTPGGDEAKCLSGWPVQPVGLKPSRSWMAYQEQGGSEFLHVGTDSDAPVDTPATDGHIFRVNLVTGAIDQEYGPTKPGSHVRGGLQILDDPEFPSDARIYVGCHEDAAGGNQASFFSIIADDTDPNVYLDEWAPNQCGTGDIDTLAMFDDAQLYFGDSDGVFWGLDRVTGLELTAGAWPGGVTLEAGQPIRSFPMIPIYGGGPIWVGNDNGKVFVVSRADGSLQRTYRLGDGKKVRSLSFTDDGAGNTVVAAITSDGFVYLLEP